MMLTVCQKIKVMLLGCPRQDGMEIIEGEAGQIALSIGPEASTKDIGHINQRVQRNGGKPGHTITAIESNPADSGGTNSNVQYPATIVCSGGVSGGCKR